MKRKNEDIDPHIDFIGIGETKSASTWIFQCLKEHPDICGSRFKETHFFDRHYERGLKWYEEHFDHCSNGKLRGEFTPGYLRKNCAERIYTHFPNVKLLVCLRNPVDRLTSHYYFKRSKGKASKDIDEHFQTQDLTQVLYCRNINRFFEYFPRDQILITLFDDIAKNPKVFIQQFYRFLGVDETFEPPSLYAKKNETVERMMKIYGVDWTLWTLRRIIENFKDERRIFNFLRMIGVRWLVIKIFKWNRAPENKMKNIKKAYPSQREVQRIIEYCKDDIERLELLIDRDLSHWKDETNFVNVN